MKIKFVRNGIEAIKRLAMGKKEKDTELISSILFEINWCRGTTSNCRHGDFQTKFLKIQKYRNYKQSILFQFFSWNHLEIFGSYAHGNQKPDADVDILVDIDPSVGREFVTLAKQIEQLLGLPVELVSRRAIKPNKIVIH